MDKQDKDKIEKIIADRKNADVLFRKKSGVYLAFLNMEQKTYRSNQLDKKTKELIAIGISVHINCESCMEWHVKQALDDGATPEQVIEAIEVGIEMGGGPATVSGRFALKVLEYYTSK